jgi:trans-AT polyketide synthase/acyltransferase/oxidoreductase domain-containing protein
MITAALLGSAEFKADYGIKYAYLAGAMYKGIASKELVIALGKAGLLGYLGTGGPDLDEIESSIRHIQSELVDGQSYGMNLLSNMECPELEARAVDPYFKCGIRFVEAAAFTRITPSLARYRLKGLVRSAGGAIETPHRILAKVSGPEVALVFMQPAPEMIVRDLLASSQITASEGELGRLIPMADEVCVEADSGGYTDQGVASALMPAMIALRDEVMAKYGYRKRIRVGAVGGIGTPHAADAAFVLGADFILAGSIN